MQSYMNLNPAPVNPVDAIKNNFNHYALRFEHSINGYANILRNNANQQRYEAAKTHVDTRLAKKNARVIPKEVVKQVPSVKTKTRVEKYNNFSDDFSYRFYQTAKVAKTNLNGLATYAREDTLEFIRRSAFIIGVTFVAVAYGLSLLNLARPIPMMPRF